jgi:hypothetical protein
MMILRSFVCYQPFLRNWDMFTRMATVFVLANLLLTVSVLAGATLRVSVFEVDASPPIGSPLAYDPTVAVASPLSCRGIVLMGKDDPVVLCTIDWIGLSNGGYQSFRESLADAAGTTPERVAVHALHQHDAPRCDFTTNELLARYGLSEQFFDVTFARDVMSRAAVALRESLESARPVSKLGLGQAKVDKVASNRRILGPDAKVEHMRFTACKDPEIRARPTGVIDPHLKMVSFWSGEQPVAVLTYYATHPQSYYRTGRANPDFPGMARNQRQHATGVHHVHFTGAGGNIGAGKWNDGSPENRPVLAGRLAVGMAEAWQSTVKATVEAEDLDWKSLRVQLPIAKHLEEAKLEAILRDESAPITDRFNAADDLVWLRRFQAGEDAEISCLVIGDARLLHMPGELFVEYQLAAQRMRPDLFVAMAAYGEYGPGYIGTEVAYSQGGYETSPRASSVAPDVESVLMTAMRDILAD